MSTERAPGGAGAPGGGRPAAGLRQAPDAVLAARAGRGDEAAFAELYGRHARAVRREARDSGLSADAAEDLTEETFLHTLQALRGGGTVARVREHLLATVRRMAADWPAEGRPGADRPAADWSSAGDWPAAEGGGEGAAAPADGNAAGGPSAEEQALRRAERGILATAYRSLPPRWRKVLWLTAVERQPPERVGRELGLTPNAAAVLAHRAREGLRQAYLQAHVSAALTGRASCRRYANKLGAGLRRPSMPRGLRRHLDACARCRSAYLELADLNARLREVLPVAVAGWFAASLPTGGSPALDVAAGTGLGSSGAAAGASGTGGVLGKFAVAAAVALAGGPAAPGVAHAAGDEAAAGAAPAAAGAERPAAWPTGRAAAEPAAGEAGGGPARTGPGAGGGPGAQAPCPQLRAAVLPALDCAVTALTGELAGVTGPLLPLAQAGPLGSLPLDGGPLPGPAGRAGALESPAAPAPLPGDPSPAGPGSVPRADAPAAPLAGSAAGALPDALQDTLPGAAAGGPAPAVATLSAALSPAAGPPPGAPSATPPGAEPGTESATEPGTLSGALSALTGRDVPGPRSWASPARP
ncbi:sigma-70 family RNA polymerase sigma factor [Streptomyces hoynatensis]|uniref:Sigma-70 family RNA polymerase sigma factor n=2 Tax=Streptomyces hoynatensis TaxID=1141874 RepID=A0A3A9YV72_9ACTN|nr:sigma-70 family RNA polymerase sigma factor [Streptomyces hoynatensis]